VRGGDEHQGWLDSLEARADLVKELEGIVPGYNASKKLCLEARADLGKELEGAFDREVLEAAEAEVQPQVSARDWKIFKDLTAGGRRAADVAADLGMEPTAVLMVKSRVLKRLRLSVQRLEESGPGAGS
jgi:hypothetical protein